ncbi:MAG: FapA family protein [Proteobacteria bacterium]|nr:FapA family protein [Pseudomonadota bacterium]MBU1387192.1 FapA family protein [Pseudomonadota bacterium]MBU1541490.1 FapA family protein [Pseudomonadota bacterium]MBU2480017.1 FapA family protein [Pseudomonadota bacterium]
MLAKFALQKKLISEQDCQKAIEACRFSKNFEQALKEYFITHNLIAPNVLEQLVNMVAAVKIIQKNIKFGAIAVEMGFIDSKVLEAALLAQKKRVAENNRPKLIGQILMESGHLTQDQLDRVVAEQQKIKTAVKLVQEDAPAQMNETPAVMSEDDSKTPVNEFNLSEKVPGGMILEIEDNGLTAFLTKTQSFSDVVAVDDILSILQMKNIQYGIVETRAIEGFLRSKEFVGEKRFEIASGRPAMPGTDARIEYYFDTDHLKAGTFDEKENIDFKDRGPIPRVEANTLLARKFPFRESRNGRDIFGRELIAAPAVDMSLKIESGAVLSEDQTQVYAQVSGHPVLSWSGEIGVIDRFTVKGDVGYKTGHIEYGGDIDVQGGLKSGFRIDGYHIDIAEVDGGQIYARGDVKIAKGVNNAKIYSRGHVSAHFIHDSQIYCLGDVTVEKEIVDSRIESSGACQIKTGNIVNSEMSFNQGVFAKNIGTEKASPDKIRIGQDLFIARELETIDSKMADIKKDSIALTQKKDKLVLDTEQLQQSAAQFANELDKALELGQETKMGIQKMEEALYHMDINKAQIKEIENTLGRLKGQIDDLHQEKINFTDWARLNTGKSVLSVDGKLFPGTVIFTPHAQKEIKEMAVNVQITESVLQAGEDGATTIYDIHINDAIRKK